MQGIKNALNVESLNSKADMARRRAHSLLCLFHSTPMKKAKSATGFQINQWNYGPMYNLFAHFVFLFSKIKTFSNTYTTYDIWMRSFTNPYYMLCVYKYTHECCYRLKQYLLLFHQQQKTCPELSVFLFFFA